MPVTAHTDEFKADAVARVIEGGERQINVARDLNVEAPTLGNWIALARLRARRAAAAQEVDDGTTPEQRGEQDKAVQAFMAYITTPKPRRSVPQLRATVDRLRAKLAADNGPAGVTRLRVVAERLNAEEELEAAERVALDPEMVAKLEGDFAAVAKPWATRNAIPVGAFRELGVHPRVLKAAGLH